MTKKIIKHAIIAIIFYLIAYIIAIWSIQGGINFDILLEPYAYMMLSEVHLVKTIALTVGILSLSISFASFYATKTNADKMLIILSYCFPIVGLILGVVYRVKQEKSTSLSNTYLLTAVASITPLLIVSFYFLAFI